MGTIRERKASAKKTARGSASARFYNVRGGRRPVAPVLVEVDGYYAKVRVRKGTETAVPCSMLSYFRRLMEKIKRHLAHLRILNAACPSLLMFLIL